MVTTEELVSDADIFVSSTGNFNIITLEHMKKMKNNSIVGNIGHFDNDIDTAGFEGLPGTKCENIKPQVDRFVFPDDPCFWLAPQFGLSHWSRFFCHVMLVHQPSSCSHWTLVAWAGVGVCEVRWFGLLGLCQIFMCATCVQCVFCV